RKSGFKLANAQAAFARHYDVNRDALVRLCRMRRKCMQSRQFGQELPHKRAVGSVTGITLDQEGNGTMPKASISPLATYNEHLRRGELGYQFSPSLGSAVFYPRVIAPKTG